MQKILLSLVVASSCIVAEGAFSLGHKNFSFGLTQNGEYTVIGANAHYMVMDDLSVGLGITTWVGDKPSITKFSVPVTYYIPMESVVRPYVGFFLSHTFMGNDGVIEYSDYNSFGARGGVVVDVAPNMYAYAGWVQVKHSGDNLIDYSDGYPEFGIGASF